MTKSVRGLISLLYQWNILYDPILSKLERQSLIKNVFGLTIDLHINSRKKTDDGSYIIYLIPRCFI